MTRDQRLAAVIVDCMGLVFYLCRQFLCRYFVTHLGSYHEAKASRYPRDKVWTPLLNYRDKKLTLHLTGVRLILDP